MYRVLKKNKKRFHIDSKFHCKGAHPLCMLLSWPWLNTKMVYPHHSTETAITVVYNDFARAADNGHVCALVLLDLSAAFDTVDHRILLDILNKCFACRDDVLDWFQSYLTGWSQVYRVASASVSVPLCFGVPQGGIDCRTVPVRILYGRHPREPFLLQVLR